MSERLILARPPLVPLRPRSTYEGLDLLSTAVLVIESAGRVLWANQAAETLFEVSRRSLSGQPAARLFGDEAMVEALIRDAAANAFGRRSQFLELRRPLRDPLPVHAVATALYDAETPLVLELLEVEQQLRSTREERQHDLTESNRRLLRNLAHEIKNPLGGIRGAAQLLDDELPSAEQREYTRVIIAEADRLQALVDKVLAPHRAARVIADVNLHEVCERVRAVILAEFPRGLTIVRDYDASAPDFRGDREQLIQALLNIVRNAAEALEARMADGSATVELRTRIARQVTIARRPWRLALDLRVADNGPGIPEEIRPRVFDPLFSGREGGSGLGLTLAQAYVQQNDGLLEFESRPGRTEFRILLPVAEPGAAAG
jgi:two-component system nitrogen regulation sensor histidine kinase GlnL